MSNHNLPPGVTQSMIDGPADPRDLYVDDELWDACDDKRQNEIRADYLSSNGMDILGDIEDGKIDARKARRDWLAYRDEAIDRLLFAGLIELPDRQR